MKPLAFALVGLLATVAAAQTVSPPRALEIKPLVAEKDGDIDQLLANMQIASSNLNSILNVLDSPEKATPADLKTANEKLAGAIRQAEPYVEKGDMALARADLPRREKAMVSFPRISLIEEGDENVVQKELATALQQTLACQYSVLNLRMDAKPSGGANDTRAKFESYLAKSRKDLAAARKQSEMQHSEKPQSVKDHPGKK
jgi:hypothetical protein